MMPHGHYSRYKWSGCRCEACRKANARYVKFNEALGTTLVDAAPARAHVAMLRATGMGRRTIAARSGVAASSITNLIYGKNGKPLRRIKPSTAAAILAVKPGHIADGAQVDITGTARRLQALAAIGWPQSWLADRIGWTPANLVGLVHAHRPRVQQATADKVRALYDELSMQPGPSGHARTVARKHGWAPPLAWDDETIDDPSAAPDGHHRVSRSGVAEDVLELLEMGETVDAIAQRLGITVKTVQTYAHRELAAS